jgi:mRNA-degrading endonuclease toxin of MazEF toxin-antitoxin module
MPLPQPPLPCQLVLPFPTTPTPLLPPQVADVRRELDRRSAPVPHGATKADLAEALLAVVLREHEARAAAANGMRPAVVLREREAHAAAANGARPALVVREQEAAAAAEATAAAAAAAAAAEAVGAAPEDNQQARLLANAVAAGSGFDPREAAAVCAASGVALEALPPFPEGRRNVSYLASRLSLEPEEEELVLAVSFGPAWG